MMLTVSDGAVLRAQTPVVRGLNFDVPAGGCHGVIGPNGSGKSTLLLGLRGQLAMSGQVTIDGVCPQRTPRTELARRVAVVPQRMEFTFPYHVDEMVLLGRSPHRKPWQAFDREDRELVATLLERLGIADLADARVDEISGGERRKVFLARALAQATPILFLDEPLAGLDAPAQEELVHLIRQLREAEQKTIVIVLHDLRLTHDLCDRVIGLRAGEQAFEGAVDEVMNASRLEQLFGVGWSEYTAPGRAPLFVPDRKAPDGDDAVGGDRDGNGLDRSRDA